MVQFVGISVSCNVFFFLFSQLNVTVCFIMNKSLKAIHLTFDGCGGEERSILFYDLFFNDHLPDFNLEFILDVVHIRQT